MASPVRFLAGVTLSGVLLFSPAALAQQACPQGFSCVQYAGETIVVDPAGGPIQYLVWSETTESVRTISTETTAVSYEILPLTSNGDTFVAGEIIRQSDTGIFKDSEPGDLYVLTKAE